MEVIQTTRPTPINARASSAAGLWCSANQARRSVPDVHSRAGEDAQAAPLRVLIVEDEVLIAMSLESLVEDFGYEVCGVAVTGEDAVRQAMAAKPDLVLMDVALAGQMDGIEAARQMRQALAARVVFLTAYGAPATLERIRTTVPSAPVVQKPVTSSALLRVIRRTAPGGS